MNTTKISKKVEQPRVRNWLAVAAKFRNAGSFRHKTEERGGTRNLQAHWLDEVFQDEMDNNSNEEQ
jgi:hypothetical protein